MAFENHKGYCVQVSDGCKREYRAGDPSFLWKPQHTGFSEVSLLLGDEKLSVAAALLRKLTQSELTVELDKYNMFSM